MDANRLFLVYIFVAEGRARGPTIPGFDDFLTFVFSKRIIFAFMRIPFEGEDLWLLLLLLGCHYVTEDNLIWNFYICDFIWLQLFIQICIQVAFSEKGRDM